MDIIKIFNEKIKQKNINWTVKGLIDENNKVFSLGSDSKLIGRIFELVTNGVLQEIADENGYILEPSTSQTVYPDYTLINKVDNIKIAVDIKTTYREKDKRGNVKTFVYCLGAYGSYIRNNTKNIKYPYDEYSEHYMICFLYSRNGQAEEGIEVDLNEIDTIKIPYENVQYAIQEKYKIVGDNVGSGNTENMGSFKTNKFEDIVQGNGPFSVLGEDIYLDYWKNYPRYKEKIKVYTNLDGYFEWKIKNCKDESELENIQAQIKQYNGWRNNR